MSSAITPFPLSVEQALCVAPTLLGIILCELSPNPSRAPTLSFEGVRGTATLVDVVESDCLGDATFSGPVYFARMGHSSGVMRTSFAGTSWLMTLVGDIFVTPGGTEVEEEALRTC